MIVSENKISKVCHKCGQNCSVSIKFFGKNPLCVQCRKNKNLKYNLSNIWSNSDGWSYMSVTEEWTKKEYYYGHNNYINPFDEEYNEFYDDDGYINSAELYRFKKKDITYLKDEYELNTIQLLRMYHNGNPYDYYEANIYGYPPKNELKYSWEPILKIKFPYKREKNIYIRFLSYKEIIKTPWGKK